MSATTHAGWEDAAEPEAPMDDPVLLARGGDREAFGRLVERFWPEMVALARTLLAGDAEAEDLVQDAFVHAWQRLGSLRRPESFPAWMRRIVARRCLRWARRNPRRREEISRREIGNVPAGAERLDVARVLAALAPRQRAVIYLTEVEGWTYREAAGILGLLPATVRVHRFRALKHLRRLLGGQP
jgi:RNA polymerase sigma-70 factor, ECF subfamily